MCLQKGFQGCKPVTWVLFVFRTSLKRVKFGTNSEHFLILTNQCRTFSNFSTKTQFCFQVERFTKYKIQNKFRAFSECKLHLIVGNTKRDNIQNKFRTFLGFEHHFESILKCVLKIRTIQNVFGRNSEFGTKS